MNETTALSPKKENSLNNYARLRFQVRAVLAAGKRRAEDAVEREKVRTCWEIGKLIIEHVLNHTSSEEMSKDRASYGEQVIKRLSKDLGISHTELKYMVEFARTYPIGRAPGQLTWSHYQELLGVNDAQKRDALAKRAVKEKMTSKALRREISKSQNSKAIISIDQPLVPIKGTLDTYRIVKSSQSTDLFIDLGFSNYFELPRKYQQKFKEGDIVKARNGSFPLALGGNPQIGSPTKTHAALPQCCSAAFGDDSSLLFTYRAYLIEATDADTIWFWIDLGFGFRTKQHLRLRGIDAPEIATRDGQVAKKFIEKELKKASEITITSTKSDKYDRYLADVYYIKAGKEYFLNNELLKRRLAVRAFL